MSLSAAQLAVIKADILADATLNVFPNNEDGAFAIAVIYNQQAVPDFWVWRKTFSIADVKKQIVWAEYTASAITDPERNAFALMISNHNLDYSDLNIRQGVAAIFDQAQSATTFANLQAGGRRLASRIEKLLSSGGDGSTGSPSVSAFDDFYTIPYQDVLTARNS